MDLVSLRAVRRGWRGGSPSSPADRRPWCPQRPGTSRKHSAHTVSCADAADLTARRGLEPLPARSAAALRSGRRAEDARARVQACCAAAVTVPQRVSASEKSPASRHSWDMASGCQAGGTVSRAIPAPREIAFLVRSWCFHSRRRSYNVHTAGPGRVWRARAAAAPGQAPSIHPGSC